MMIELRQLILVKPSAKDKYLAGERLDNIDTRPPVLQYKRFFNDGTSSGFEWVDVPVEYELEEEDA